MKSFAQGHRDVRWLETLDLTFKRIRKNLKAGILGV